MPRTKIQKGDSFSALWKRQDMAWANPGIERRLQSWLWRSLSCRRKAQLPSFTVIHHSHHASPFRTWFRHFYYENENYYFFCFYYDFFGSYSFFLGIDTFSSMKIQELFKNINFFTRK